MAPGTHAYGILVVDDQPAVSGVIRMMLETQGYNVWTAGSGTEAIELFKQHQSEVTLLVTDVVMPEINGPELVDALLAAKPDLPVLYVSGYCGDCASQMRSFQCLPKPFTANELLDKVADLMPLACAGS